MPDAGFCGPSTDRTVPVSWCVRSSRPARAPTSNFRRISRQTAPSASAISTITPPGVIFLGIVRSVFVTMGPVTKSSALDRLFGSEAEANRALVEKALGAMKSRKAADARAVYAKLPPSLKKNRLLYTGVHPGADDRAGRSAAYAAALADGVVLFPAMRQSIFSRSTSI